VPSPASTPQFRTHCTCLRRNRRRQPTLPVGSLLVGHGSAKFRVAGDPLGAAGGPLQWPSYSSSIAGWKGCSRQESFGSQALLRQGERFVRVDYIFECSTSLLRVVPWYLDDWGAQGEEALRAGQKSSYPKRNERYCEWCWNVPRSELGSWREDLLDCVS